MGRQDARSIAQNLLDMTGHAVMTRDYEMFWPHFNLPQTIMTPDGQRTSHNLDEFRQVFEAIHDHLISQKVTDLIRSCVAADFKSENVIETTHVSHVMSGAQRIAEPYPVFSVLHALDGRWKIMSSDYAVEPKSSISRALMSSSVAEPKVPSSQTNSVKPGRLRTSLVQPS